MNMIDYDLLSIQEARILVENASQAQKRLSAFPQEALDRAVEGVAAEMKHHLRELALLSVQETDYGNWEDKLLKGRFVCENVCGALRGMKCVGIIRRDTARQTMDVGVPRGTIVALCPAASPVSTTIYKVLIAIKSGNTIIFSPNPKAKKTMSHALDLMIRAAEANGLPQGAVSYLHTVSLPGIAELMNHSAVAMLLLTGVPSMLPLAEKSGKQILYGGTGSGPVFIERTADLEQAVQDIVCSKTFDYGTAVAAEQSVVVDAPVSSAVKREFQRAGAYFMEKAEADRLGRLIFRNDGNFDEKFIGKSAAFLARAAGFTVPEGTSLLLTEQDYVSQKAPFIKETLCPVLAYYVEEDWQHACEKCIELLLSEKRSHTLTIHSRDPLVIEQFALKKPVARVLVNTPGVFGGIGMTTNLFPAMTLGSGPAGLGATADNVSPLNLIYIRKVGWGVRTADLRRAERKLDNPGLARLKAGLKEILTERQ